MRSSGPREQPGKKHVLQHNGMFLRIWLHPLRRQKCVNYSLRGSFLGGISDVKRHRLVRHHWWCKWCYRQYNRHHQFSLFSAGFRFFTRVSSTHFLICTFAYTPTPRFWYPTYELAYLPTPKNLKQAAKRTHLPRKTCSLKQQVAKRTHLPPPEHVFS